MRTIILTLLIVCSLTGPSLSAEGLVSQKSPFTVRDTIDRLEKIVKDKGLKVFARIDHAEGAASVGKTLRPTEVILFGNPKGGTPFMLCAQTIGIDLPLKALAWEDAGGQVWLGYNAPEFLAQRHGVKECTVVDTLSKALTNMTKQATSP